jgi:carbon monoxide dehydrogenase subunit G
VKFDGKVTINAPRDKVWKFVTDAESVSKCAPGLESLEIVKPDKQFKVVAGVGFGAVKVIFTTDVEWTELDAPKKAAMKAHGTAPGSAVDVTAEMSLGEGPDKTTEMAWEADVTLSGTIVSLASRLMSSVTKKLTTAFFDCMKKQIEA